MRNVKKFYGNPKKTLMYDIQVNNKGLIGGIEFRGPDRKKIFKGAIDVEKNPLKFSEAKKDKVFEYLIFLLYYPAMVERDFKMVSTEQLPSMLKACKITNPIIVENVLNIRHKRDKEKRNQNISRKRKN